MKRILYLGLLTIMAFTVILTGCQSGAPDNGKQEIEIRSAPIHDIQVNIAESYPPQVFVRIKVGLKDECTTLHDITAEQKGNTINIKVTTERPRGATCAQVYHYFDEALNLGSDFTSGETYTIKVNDKSTSFKMQ